MSILSSLAASPLSDAIVNAADAAHMGLAVAFADEDAPRNVYVNGALCTMLGYTREELLARPAFDPRDGGYELTLTAKDGARVPCRISVGRTVFEGRRATIAFVADLRGQKRGSDAPFRHVIEMAPEAIGIIRGEHFVFVNRAYVRIFGYDSAEELMRIPIGAHCHPEDVPTLQARSKHLFSGGDVLPAQVFRTRRKDGSWILLEVSSVPFEYEGSIAVLSVGRDVTERKKLESQLVQADRLAALGTLAAGVAHEVNNPLAYLLLNLEWIARKLPEVAGAASKVGELSAMIDEARHSAERVGQIVRELRAFSRADGESRGHVDLRTAAQSAIKIASHELRHCARVVTDFDDDVPPVWANEARLEQVLLNLLLNAAQAMSDGDPAKNEIRVVVRADGPTRAVLEVSDNGIGIPPETVRRIFDPFFTTKPVGIGTGLGLSICHSIVASLGGQISVSSQVGEGTTFRVSLPTRTNVADSVRPPATSSSGPPRSARRARVLVVDDEVTIGNTMRDLLATDHDVQAVASGEAALDAITASTAWDVIFCDLMMPRVSGIELYERLRAEHPGLERRIVFMTGGAFTSRAADFLAKTPNRRVEKPFSLTEIERIVREMAEARA